MVIICGWTIYSFGSQLVNAARCCWCVLMVRGASPSAFLAVRNFWVSSVRFMGWCLLFYVSIESRGGIL